MAAHTRLPLMLCYHKVERRHELGVTRISPRRFARQVERFARDGWRTITADELLACVRGERVPGAREMVLTFDDAYRGLREHAFPVLEAHGYTAIISAITAYAGRLNRWDVAYGGRRFAHLAWRDMRAWQARGMEFVSHTETHPRLTWLAPGEVHRELEQSRAAVRAALDTPCDIVSYPYGAVGAREADAAREAGYRAAFRLGGRWDGDAMGITRHPVYCWAPPQPGVGVLASLDRMAGTIANRCAVGTSVWQRATRA